MGSKQRHPDNLPLCQGSGTWGLWEDLLLYPVVCERRAHLTSDVPRALTVRAPSLRSLSRVGTRVKCGVKCSLCMEMHRKISHQDRYQDLKKIKSNVEICNEQNVKILHLDNSAPLLHCNPGPASNKPLFIKASRSQGGRSFAYHSGSNICLQSLL